MARTRRARRIRRVSCGVLAVLLVVGVVLVGGGVYRSVPILVGVGAWLVALAVLGRLLLTRGDLD
jgi:hypothetical protein